MQEYVGAFPVSLLDDLGYFQGLSFDVDEYLGPIHDDVSFTFLERALAEFDVTFKQLIPYVILTHGDAIFAYKRGQLLREHRLLGGYSIGVGGHVSIHDPSLFARAHEEAAVREMTEEVTIQGNYELRRVAVINDDSDEVGRVHFGIVYVAYLESPRVRKHEKSISQLRFLTVHDLRREISKFENWSQICIDHIDAILSKGRTSPAITTGDIWDVDAARPACGRLG